MTGARSSVGGAGGAAGPGLEARVLAWFAAHLVARVSLPSTWRVTAACVDEIGGQTGEEMDDLGAITERRGYIFIQAKHRLQLSAAAGSPLREAIDQAVRQFINGAPQDSDGSRRPLEPGRDALVICTDKSASAPVREHLRIVVERLSTHPAELPLDQLAKNADERKAIGILVDHLKAAFASQAEGRLPTEEQIRAIGRLLHVLCLDVDPGGTYRLGAESRLREALDDPDTAPGAWNDLVTLGQALIEGQRWADRTAVRHALASGGHPAGVDPPLKNDVQRLRDVTRSVLDGNAPAVTIPSPEGAVAIRRDVTDVLLQTGGSFGLIGEPGAGKSVLAALLAASLSSGGEDVVFLGAESLASSLGAVRAELAMENNLDRVLCGWDGARPATLLIDGVDATRGTTSVDWIPRLVRSLADTRWRVVATIRTFDLRYGPSWQEMLAGEPVDARHADQTFPRVRHILVGDLSAAELDQVRTQSPRLADLLDTADGRLAELLRNPFNLRLAAQLLDDCGDGGALAAVRTRQDLLHLYWQRRVEVGPEHLSRRRAVRDLAETMVQRRRARVEDPSNVVDPAVLSAVDALLHDGVLREDVQGRRSGVSPVIFSHPILYDFAVAVTCLQGEDGHVHLSRRLDDDPDLAITIRPSIDIYLADLWIGDATRTSFWDLATTLSAPIDGHAIAAIAAGCATLRQHPTYDDLVPVETVARSSHDRNVAARMCIAHLAGAIEAADISDLDREASAPALADLAGALATEAATTGDIGLADLARVLLFRLDRRFPLTVDSISAQARSLALADIMRCALSIPAQPMRETLAMKIGDAVTRAAAVSPAAVCPVIADATAPEVMAIWGGRVASQMMRPLGRLAERAPDSAERLARSVWEFDEQRDEVTSIGDSNILGLTSTRHQDLEMARFGTGEAFPAFLSAAPDAALRVFLALLDRHGAPHEGPRATGQSPLVYWSSNLEFAPGHGALGTMAAAAAAFLVSSTAAVEPSEQATADRMLELAATRLTHDQVWSAILQSGAANPSSLGRRLLPLLDNSDLLGHYKTAPFAARLVAALSTALAPAEHASLEGVILRARDPLDTSGENTQRVVDTLLGQLDPTRVVDPIVQAQIAEMNRQGGSPPAPDPPTQSGGFRAYGVRERLAELGVAEAIDNTLVQEMERVRADVVGTTSGTTEDQRSAVERLRASLTALYAAVTDSGSTGIPTVFAEASTLLVNGAERLARDASVLPGTELGEMVLGLLSAGLPSAPAGA